MLLKGLLQSWHSEPRRAELPSSVTWREWRPAPAGCQAALSVSLESPPTGTLRKTTHSVWVPGHGTEIRWSKIPPGMEAMKISKKGLSIKNPSNGLISGKPFLGWKIVWATYSSEKSQGRGWFQTLTLWLRLTQCFSRVSCSLQLLLQRL